MAEKDTLRFLTGQESNLGSKAVTRGQVYFAINSDQNSGKIYFDAPADKVDSSGNLIAQTKRIVMNSDHADKADYATNAGHATSADQAKKDSNQKVISETYISEMKLDAAGTTILYKYPDIAKWKELKPKFLPLTGGTITGELYVDGGSTLASLLVNGDARFVNTIQGNIKTADKWKTARGFQIADSGAANTGVSVNVDGSGNVVLKLPATIKATLQGNADSATKATNDSNNKKITDEYLHRASNTDATLNQFSGAPKYLLGIEAFKDGGEVKWQSVDNIKVGSASDADKWNTARNFSISDSGAAHTGTAVSVDGSKAVVLPLPATIKATLEGNASSATKVNHKYTLTLGTTAQTAFDGSADVAITITPKSIGALGKDENAVSSAKWSTARTFYVADADASNTGTGVSVDGSKDITLKLPSTIKGNLKGNADTATTATNADKLDGYHRAGLYSSPGEWIKANGYTKTITVNGNADTYYPVVISTTTEKSALNYISVWKNLGTKTAVYPGNHSNGTSSMWLIYEGRNWYWDGNGGYLKCWYYSMPYATLCAKAEQAGNGVGALVIYLRGGGTEYNISTTYNSTVTVYYETTNLGDATYPVNATPTTIIGNKGQLSSTYLGYGNVPSADIWKTARNFAVADSGAVHTGPIVSVNGSSNVTLQLPATIKASITGHASEDLPLAGGTMTGNIKFANNVGITAVMGGGNDGWGIIGTGINDNGRLKIYVTDNGTTDWIDFEFRDYSGTTYTPLSMTGNQVLFASSIRPTANNTYSLGTNDYKWSSVYATTFYGALSGTASNATSDIRGNAIINTYLTNVYAQSDDSSYLYKQVGPASERSAELIGRYTPLDSDGLINMKYIPAAALERVVVVANQAAQYALTIANVQLGDVVKRNDTGQLYFVVDTNNLNNANGYLQFTAGTAANINWSGILNRPNVVGRATGNAIVPNTANTEFTVYQVNGDGTSTSYVIKPNFLPKTGGTITGELYVDGGTTLASLLVNGDARFVNTIQGNISGNAGSATKWATAKAFYIADADAKHTSSPKVDIDGSQNSYTLKLPATIKATLEGNADTATKLTNLTTADKASSTNTWRRIWFAYDDNVNGRPAYSDTFAYQTSTGTVKATKFQGDLVGNADSASKWKTARNFITNLGSESPASVDGSTGPYNLGVTGTLPVSHGGTGKSNLADVTVGNADKLDNLHAIDFKTRIVKEKTLREAGWYRILNATTYSNTFLITFYGAYNYQPPTPVTFLVSHSYSTTKISQIGGCAYVGWITKIRAVHYDTFKFYIDIYFARTQGSNYVNFEVMPLDPNSRSYLTVVDFTLIADSVTANAECITRVNSYSDIAGKWENARTFITALNSESSASVDGSANVTMGVSGTLPASHGGTGNTSFTANRLVWTETATKMTAGYHYADSTHVGICYTSQPDKNFAVSGSVRFALGDNDNTSGRQFIIGSSGKRYLSFGGSGIQAYNASNAKSTLYLNYNGGTIEIGSSSNYADTTMYGGLTVKGTTGADGKMGFNYEGIGQAADNVDRVIWFAYNGKKGIPVYDNDFVYNPFLNRLTTGKLLISETSSENYIKFARNNWDYILGGGTSAVISINPNGLNGSANSVLAASVSAVYPGTQDSVITLGKTDSHWLSGFFDKLYVSTNTAFDNRVDTVAGSYIGTGEIVINQTTTGGPALHLYNQTYDFGLLIGTGGVNRGLYDWTNSKWMVYYDNTHYILNGNSRVNGNLYFGSNTTYYINSSGTANLNALTVNGKVKIQNTTDSKNSQDSEASVAIQGGVSVAKQLSAKSIRIDNNHSDKGCTVKFNNDTNCIEFVFD